MASRKRAGLREISPPKVPPPSDAEFLAWLNEPTEPHQDVYGPHPPLYVQGADDRLRLFALRIYLDHDLPIHTGPLLDAPRYNIEDGRAVEAQQGEVCLAGLGERIIGPDTEAALAGRILSELRFMEIAARDNNANLMRRAAMAAGALGEVFSIEFEYGPILSNLSALEEGRATRARNAKAAGDVERARVQGWANEVWADKPALSAASVAVIVAKRHGGNPNTIRRQIEKPVTPK